MKRESLLLVVAAALLLCVTAAFGYFRVLESDVFWHLRTGQVILETGRLVRTNLFSSIFPDQPWHNLEWLHQVALAIFFNHFGWPGVMGLKLLLMGLTALALFALMVRRSGRPLLALGLVTASFTVFFFRFVERPQLFSLLFFALTLLTVDAWRRGSRRALWALPPLYALWANIHPELVTGLLYIAAVAAGELLGGRRSGKGSGGRAARLLGTLALCAAATLLNPEGWRPLLSSFQLGEVAPVMANNEFLKTTLANDPLFWVAAAVVLAVLLWRRAETDWAEIVALAGFLVLGGLYVRAVSAFAMVAAPALHRLLAGAGGPSTRSRGAVTGIAGAAAAAATLWCFTAGRAILPRTVGVGPDPAAFPVAAAEFLAAHELPGRLFNRYDEGGYLIFRLWPRTGVFQDSRFQPYPREFMRRTHGASFASDYPRILEEYGVNTVLFPTVRARGLFPREQWGMVYWDDRFAVLVRRTDAASAVLSRYEYRRFEPGWDPAAHPPVELPEAVAEMRRNQAERLAPDPWVALQTGISLGRLGRFDEAEREVRRALELDPRQAAAWGYLGGALERLGRKDEARRAYREALRLDPAIPKVKGWLDRIDGR